MKTKTTLMSKVIPAVLGLGLAASSVQAGFVVRLFYDGSLDAGGARTTDYNDLIANSALFPNGVTFSETVLNRMRTDINDGDDYGSLIQGYIIAPFDGDYAIAIGSDDSSALWLSEDTSIPANFPSQNPAGHRDPDVEETGCCQGLFGGQRLAERTTGPITLTKGEYRYFEMVSQEGGGGAYMEIGWTRPDGVQEIIPAIFLHPYIQGNLALANGEANGDGVSSINPVSGPTDLTVVETEPATFWVDPIGGALPLTFQWKRGGSDITGATLPGYILNQTSIADNGATFSCVVTDANGAVVTSRTATLIVQADSTKPILESVDVGIIDPNIITLVFNEVLDSESAQAPGSYSINNDATVESAELQADNKTVIITASGVVDSKGGYQITVTGVRDATSNKNQIDPVTQDLVLFPGGVILPNADGHYVFEAESYDEILGEDVWVEDTERGNPSGGKAMVAPNGAGGSEAGTQLHYFVQFAETGEHIVWYRASGDNGNDDSGWFWIDGARPPERANGNEASMTGFSGQADYVWVSNAQAGSDPFTFNVNEAGQHTVTLARREDGSFFDKFLITKDADYTPEDLGPPESPRSESTPKPDPRIEFVTDLPAEVEGV